MWINSCWTKLYIAHTVNSVINLKLPQYLEIVLHFSICACFVTSEPYLLHDDLLSGVKYPTAKFSALTRYEVIQPDYISPLSIDTTQIDSLLLNWVDEQVTSSIKNGFKYSDVVDYGC